MKIAITSKDNNLNSKLDSRFGRCSYFAIYDTEGGNVEFYSNPSKESTEGAGPASAQFVASKGVQKVISGEFGFKVKNLFESLGIEAIDLKETEKSITEVIRMLNN
jgi:predicted Fe-Mo cluster-binding NifX family protein